MSPICSANPIVVKAAWIHTVFDGETPDWLALEKKLDYSSARVRGGNFAGLANLIENRGGWMAHRLTPNGLCKEGWLDGWMDAALDPLRKSGFGAPPV